MIAAASEALTAHEWNPKFSWSAHDQHRLDAIDCAVCRGDWERVMAVVLEVVAPLIAAAALRDAAEDLTSHIPVNFELRPDGSEDPIRAAYVEAAHDLWAELRERARALSPDPEKGAEHE